VLVGQNIRICRLQKGLSQTELGEAIGVTFQQIQKYEKGTNRVGASRMLQIAQTLGVSLSTLFDGSPTAGESPKEQTARYLLAKPHSVRLMKAFDQIADDKMRMVVLELVESIVNQRPRKSAPKTRAPDRR
jgi:transcriptional regulator with XRE-family HTH domain